MVALVAGFLASGLFTVKSNEVAMVLRFGKPRGQFLKQGLHWAFPYPIDQVVRVPVNESHTVTSTAGWYATTPDLEKSGQEPPPRPSLVPGVDGYALTGDGNIIHVRATLKYRITDPWQYAFNFAGSRSAAKAGSVSDPWREAFNFAQVTNLIQNVLNNALFYAAAQFTADAALYKNPSGFRDLLLARVNRAIAEYQLGITLEPSDVRTSAPLDVRAAFEAVQSAEQERSKKINEAEGYANQVIVKAQGEAMALINDGVTWSNQLVQAINAEQKYFTNQLPYYLRDPGLFKQRLLTEHIERVLTNAQDKFFLPQRQDGQRRELRIQLNREPQKIKGVETP
jgi:membrane protease subunit HflK